METRKIIELKILRWLLRKKMCYMRGASWIVRIVDNSWFGETVRQKEVMSFLLSALWMGKL